MRKAFSTGGTQRQITVDLGDEPPIEADGGRRTEDDHRRVSLHWLAGTVLTGLCGAGLIGASAFVALDRRLYTPETPQVAQALRKDDKGDATINPRKGDRLVKAVDIVAAKQSFKAPTAVRVGDKEVIRTVGYTRVATSLTLTETGLGEEVPPFNPLKLLAAARNGSEAPAADDGVAAIDNAEVSFVVSDLVSQKIQAQPAILSMDEVQAQVGEFLKSVAAGSRAPAQMPAQMMLMRTSRAGPSLAYANAGEPLATSAPFTSIEVKMVPENVTLITKSPPLAEKQPTQMEERLEVIRRGESLEDVLRANAVPKAAIAAILAAFGGRKADQVAVEGRRVKMLFADLDGSGGAMVLARMSIHSDDRIEATVAVADDGRYVQVTRAEEQQAAAQKPKKSDDEDDDEDSGGMRLYDSLYQTALKQEVPKAMIGDLVRIFANDVDFQRSVAPGDTFEAFYDESDGNEDHDQLLFAAITTRNETYKYYRYRTTDDGLVDYYDENGRSTRKFLIRQPIGAARITSGFGSRYHPILGYTKIHTGVDFAAPIGTPIFAAGNGTVLTAGWHSGYGRRVEIQHANGYVTAYNHMSGFGRGIAEGVRVRQGQLVGFLGSSGLSTGPHLHYEVMVNGRFVDPMRVKLARTREIEGKLLVDFKRERDRIDSLVAKAAPAGTRVAARNAVN